MGVVRRSGGASSRPLKSGKPMVEEHAPRHQLEERGLTDILSETFVIYGRHFWKFVVLVAVVQVPATLLVFIPMEGRAAALVFNFVNVIALMLAYGATIYAVGQHYVTNSVSVGGCYARVLWRVVSIVVLAVILAALMVSVLLLSEVTALAVIPLLLLAAASLLGYAIYLTAAAPAVIIEGYRSLTALRRGFNLARSSEGRILGHLLVYSLVAVGMLVVLILPFGIAAVATTPEEEISTINLSPAMMLGSVVVGVVVPPVTYIATTLLYYDLRVRKEGYDVSRLSSEMGVASV